MKKNKRYVALILCVAMLTALMPTVSFAASVPMFGCDALIELEKGAIAKGATLSAQKDKNASAGKYLLCTRSGNNDDPDGADPELTFKLEVPTEGNYNIWFRYGADGKGSDSLYINFDDETMNGTSKQVSVLTENGGFYWQNIKKQTLTAGVHTVKITPRENGMRLDCLYITADNDYKPEELVKAEEEAAAQKAEEEAKALEIAKTGIYFDKTAPVFKTDKSTGGVVFEAEDMLLKKDLGSVVAESTEKASGGKVLNLTTNNKTVPDVSSAAAAEAFVEVSADGDYDVWMRYAAVTNGNDSVFISYNGSLYKSSHASATTYTGASDTFTWIKIHTFEGIKAGDKINLRIMGREPDFIIDQFVFTNNKIYTPSGKVTEVWGGDNIKPLDFDASIYSKPPKPNTTEHPRVLLTKDDIPIIKERFNDYENKYAYEQFLSYLKKDINNGVLPNHESNYDEAVLEVIYALAFDYVINGNEQSARAAIDAISNFFKTVSWPTQGTVYGWKGYTMYIAAIVYDWCYDIMTDDERAFILGSCEIMSMGNEIGFPPNKQGAVTGHGSEYQYLRDWVALAIAVADEYPDVYDFVIGRVYDEYVEPRKYWYGSGTHHQGTNYGPARYASDVWCEYLLSKIGQPEIFGPDMKNYYYQILYMQRADGQYLRIGDTFDDGAVFWRSRMKNASFLSANIYKNPYFKRAYALADPTYTWVGTGYDSISSVTWLILNDPTVEEKSISNLPMSKYFGSPDGSIIARTGWDYGMESESVLAYMNIGEVWAANHDHRDAGDFQIFYKGILAGDSGSYFSYGYAENGVNYDFSYYKATIAHNCLLIYNPNEKMPNSNRANTGGQVEFGGEVANFGKWMTDDKYRTGYVTAHEIDDQERVARYNYISGDITRAYGEKAEEVRRSMLFMPTEDANKPAVFFVMDKVTSSDASYEKYWLMHPLYEPKIDGNMMIIENTELGNSGQLVNTTLYPKEINIATYGGETENKFKNFQIADKSRWGEGAEINQWRIDVTPAAANKTDYFLNAMYVADVDNNVPHEKAELVETNDMLGAVLVDRAALFVKDGANKVSEQSFTLPERENLSVFVCGLNAGNYEVTENGNVIANVVATEDGGCIFFDANGGDYTIKNTDASATRTVGVYPEGNDPITVTVLFAGKPVYCDVPARVVDDRTLIPFRALFETMDCSVEWDADTMSATATDGETTIVLTENNKTAYVNGEAKELDVPAQIIDGRFLIPLRFVSESMGCAVKWNEFGQFVDVSSSTRMTAKKFGIDKPVSIKSATAASGEGEGMDGNVANVYDGTLSTYWAPLGKDGEAWGVFDLGAEYKLDKMYACYSRGNERIYTFDVLVSTDGETFTPVLTGAKSTMIKDGFEVFDMGGADARYVKYIGRGNSTNLWNSVCEIIFSRAE